MEMKQEMVTLTKVHDAYSGVCLMDTTSTLATKLNKIDINRYAKALHKVRGGTSLNRKDLTLFDKIDELTFEAHGMCLKDSQVTKARLKACKKQRIEFIDRDGLVDHMNLMMPEHDENLSKVDFYKKLGEFFIEHLGEESMHALQDLIRRFGDSAELTLKDLQLLSKLEEVAATELDWTIINQEMRAAINKACKKLGIYFQNLQQVMTH